ncbi:MAG: hypothetical protein RL199_575 [Pseudomonadota bacterium]|jgi:hypothetical protein
MRTLVPSSLVAAVVLAGCQDCARSDTIHIAIPVEKPPVAKLDIDGRVDRFAGDTTPVRGSAYLLWDLPNEDGAVYRYGDAPVAGDGAFKIHLDTAAPGAALTDGVVGVANFVLFPTGTPVPSGPIQDEALQALLPSITGASGTFVVVDKRKDVKNLPWLAAFPMGLACGRARPFDPSHPRAARGFEPVDCREVSFPQGSIENVEFTPWYKPPAE